MPYKSLKEYDIPTNRFLEKTISKSQRCQRNWDLTKSIPIEDIKTLKTSITDCSSKQNKVFYKCKFITNRNVIESLYNLSEGAGYFDKEDNLIKVDKNPQVLANLVVAFIRDRDPSEKIRNRQERKNGRFTNNNTKLGGRDENIALGIAAGYLTLTANMLGYSSGCCQCGDPLKMAKILDEESPVLLLMGIGFPNQNISRLEHHVTGRRFYSFNKNIIVDDVV